MINKYPGICSICGTRVRVGSGFARKKDGRWVVDHADCANSPITIRFQSGETMTQNRNGRCEDAPCCGCCT
jgi:hypothetical protein